MSAPVVLVHSDQETHATILATLRGAGFHVAAFHDPVAALEAVEKDSKVRVLIALTDFGEGKLNGVALMRMLRLKQISQDGKSSLRGVFVGSPTDGHHARGEGEFVPTPIDPIALVNAVREALAGE